MILPQGGGLVLVGEDGVRKSKFPRGCEQAPAGGRAVATPVHCKARGDEDVLERLCDPKHFTGTAATGHLPTVVDLEGGVGVSRRLIVFLALLVYINIAWHFTAQYICHFSPSFGFWLPFDLVSCMPSTAILVSTTVCSIAQAVFSLIPVSPTSTPFVPQYKWCFL